MTTAIREPLEIPRWRKYNNPDAKARALAGAAQSVRAKGMGSSPCIPAQKTDSVALIPLEHLTDNSAISAFHSPA
jgi:hypothetical protein